jgi:hypothetical protein
MRYAEKMATLRTRDHANAADRKKVEQKVTPKVRQSDGLIPWRAFATGQGRQIRQAKSATCCNLLPTSHA